MNCTIRHFKFVKVCVNPPLVTRFKEMLSVRELSLHFYEDRLFLAVEATCRSALETDGINIISKVITASTPR